MSNIHFSEKRRILNTQAEVDAYKKEFGGNVKLGDTVVTREVKKLKIIKVN